MGTQQQVSTTTQFSEMRSYIGSQLRVINNNIRAYGGTIQGYLVRQRSSNSGRRDLNNADASEAVPMAEVSTAVLSNNPRTRMDLWREYKFGIDGRKAAERFTTRERNCSRSVKQKYWRRSHVYQTIVRLVQGGRTADRACIEIRRVNGFSLSMTSIITAMIQDKTTHHDTGGVHPNLC